MTILQPTFLGKQNSTPIFSFYILFLDFLFWPWRFSITIKKKDLIQQDQEIVMVIMDQRQGNFETMKLCFGFGP
jgi:hypothetical protein